VVVVQIPADGCLHAILVLGSSPSVGVNPPLWRNGSAAEYGSARKGQPPPLGVWTANITKYREQVGRLDHLEGPRETGALFF
jgi:hypothetical protein